MSPGPGPYPHDRLAFGAGLLPPPQEGTLSLNYKEPFMVHDISQAPQLQGNSLIYRVSSIFSLLGKDHQCPLGITVASWSLGSWVQLGFSPGITNVENLGVLL